MVSVEKVSLTRVRVPSLYSVQRSGRRTVKVKSFHPIYRDVAQSGGAAGLGPAGRRFESCRLVKIDATVALIGRAAGR